MEAKSAINSPNHYQSHVEGKAPGSDIECIEATYAMNTVTGFVAHCKSCALKYIWREDAKGNPAQDLGKAQKYLQFAINAYEGRGPLEDGEL